MTESTISIYLNNAKQIPATISLFLRDHSSGRSPWDQFGGSQNVIRNWIVKWWEFFSRKNGGQRIRCQKIIKQNHSPINHNPFTNKIGKYHNTQYIVGTSSVKRLQVRKDQFALVVSLVFSMSKVCIITASVA